MMPSHAVVTIFAFTPRRSAMASAIEASKPTILLVEELMKLNGG